MTTRKIELDLPTRAMRLEAEELRVHPRRVRNAFVKSLRTALRPTKTAIVKTIAKNSDVPQKAVRRRVIVKVYRRGNDYVGRVFVGLTPVSVASVMTPSKLRRAYERNIPVFRGGDRVARSFYQKPRSRRGKKNPFSTLQRTGAGSSSIRSVNAEIYSENILDVRAEGKKIERRFNTSFDYNLRQEMRGVK